MDFDGIQWSPKGWLVICNDVVWLADYSAVDPFQVPTPLQAAPFQQTTISLLSNPFKTLHLYFKLLPDVLKMALQKTLAMLLQFLMFSLVTAAPITTESHGNSWQYGAGGGVVGFIVLILDIIVFSKLLTPHLSVSKLFSPSLGSCPTMGTARVCTLTRT